SGTTGTNFWWEKQRGRSDTRDCEKAVDHSSQEAVGREVVIGAAIEYEGKQAAPATAEGSVPSWHWSTLDEAWAEDAQLAQGNDGCRGQVAERANVRQRHARRLGLGGTEPIRACASRKVTDG